MSLINEALKKAQTQRPSDGPGPGKIDPVASAAQHPQPAPAKPRSFIWGFLLALLVVGVLTFGMAAIFVWQILGTEETQSESAEAVTTVETAPVAESVPTKDAVPVTPVPQPAETLPETAQAVEAPVTATPEPVAVEEQPPSSLPVEEIPVAEVAAPPSGLAEPPDPKVIARLMELQIRGIMGGGTKVLIHDTGSGRTRAFEEGDSLEGPMGLSVSKIANASITFTDYAGKPHTKSF